MDELTTRKIGNRKMKKYNHNGSEAYMDGVKRSQNARNARNGRFRTLLSDFIFIFHSVYSVHSVVKTISTPAIALIFRVICAFRG